MIDSATGRTTTYFYDLLDRMVKYEEKGTNYSHSVSYEYDKNTNLTQQVEITNGVTTTTAYTYDDDNRIKTVTTGDTVVTYTYDTYGRVSQKVTKNGETTYKTETYTYKSSESGGVSTQVDTHEVVFNQDNQTYTYRYTYDDNGNIKTVNDGTNTINYMYDSANQLIRESNLKRDKTSVWTYDNAGNIVSRDVYGEYLTDTLDDGTLSATVNYGYTDPNWGDLLTSYDGKAIVYDALGNPTSIGVAENGGGRTYTWEHGRQLSRLTEGGSTWEYQYNADGMRTKRTNGTTTYEYVYNGSQLTQMKVNGVTYSFTYDANGTPLTLTVGNEVYYYITNLQGDVTAIQTSTGSVEALYSYDAWGVCGCDAFTDIEYYNPLRYRGYVYDEETQLYYLQSRYYDPNIGRFLNADGFTSTGQGFLGNNTFAYCNNNPANMWDPQGGWSQWIKKAKDTITKAGKAIVSAVVLGYTALSSGTLLIMNKDTHYNRNSKNSVNIETIDQVPEDWTTSNTAKYPERSQGAAANAHQNTAPSKDKPNTKFSSPDKHEEVIFSYDEVLVDAPIDIGTYNYGTNFCTHWGYDVVPWIWWGNTEDDPSTIWDRVNIFVWGVNK